MDVVVLSGRSNTRKRKPPMPLTENQLICHRAHIVSKLAAILDELKFVHIRGTPASDKTTLC